MFKIPPKHYCPFVGFPNRSRTIWTLQSFGGRGKTTSSRNLETLEGGQNVAVGKQPSSKMDLQQSITETNWWTDEVDLQQKDHVNCSRIQDSLRGKISHFLYVAMCHWIW